MRFVPSLPIVAILVLSSVAACSDEDVPEPEDLFGSRPAASPNKLHGLYKVVAEEASKSTEIRLWFGEDSLVGAARCTPVSDKFQPITVGGKIKLETDGLDSASGQFTIGTLTMAKNVDEFYCEAGLRAATYDFKVEELKLTLTTPILADPLVYAKIGD
jgi:hypothetical protein